MTASEKSKERVTSTSHRSRQTFTSASPEETKRFGERFAARLRQGDIVCLHGELGSGKTTFVQGIARGLGVRGFVRSSSFMLVNEYKTSAGRPKLYHIDLYRLCEGGEETLGLEEYLFGCGICVVEWAERVREIDRAARWNVTLTWKSERERQLKIVRKKP